MQLATNASNLAPLSLYQRRALVSSPLTTFQSCTRTLISLLLPTPATSAQMATTDATTAATAAPEPWYAAYPAPKSEVVTISREEVLELLKTTPLEKRDFVLVDLRRNDFEVRD